MQEIQNTVTKKYEFDNRDKSILMAIFGASELSGF